MNSDMIEVLCGRTPALLQARDLQRSIAFYRDDWGFDICQQIPGVFAVLQRKSVSVHLMQQRADMAPQLFACRLLVNRLDEWLQGLQSAAGRTPWMLSHESWGDELALSDCDGNRLQLVQSAAHRTRQQSRQQSRL